MSGDDIALDFMSEQEVAEILATEELLEVDMDTFNEDEIYLRKLLRTRTTNSNWIAHARRHNHGCNSYGGH
jgi:hypothetical protein